ncbi:MAG: glycosyltransferase [Anaerohalosphaeraceae bacterium]|nr:glycosyltransferase [Anaerohalosphaeraceae bacterium]
MRKKLLILSRHLSSASFRQRIALYFDALTQAGIDYEICEIPKKTPDCIRLYSKAKNFDGVLLHKKRLNFLESFFLRSSAKKIIYDFDDAVMFDNLQPEKLDRKKQSKFARTTKIADTVIAGNNYLASLAAEYNDNIKIIPTGLNVKNYSACEKTVTDNKIRLVWIGSGSNLLYLEQIKPQLEHIAKKHSNVVLRIICNKFFSLDNMPVEKIPWSLQTQAKNLKACDIGLAPLPDDKFTRGKCGFKILQYAAAGLPAIASPVGVNSDIVTNRINGFLAKNDNDWTEKISILIEDDNLRKTTGRNNLQTAAKYDISTLGKTFTNIILETI